jgi:hypothetical protein
MAAQGSHTDGRAASRSPEEVPGFLRGGVATDIHGPGDEDGVAPEDPG